MKGNIPVVLANKRYEVVFGDFEALNPNDLFPSAEKCLIVTDSTVLSLHREKIAAFSAAFRGKTYTCVLEPGESNKNIQAVEKIIDALGENNFSRKDAVFAVGGGVVSDIAGFAAGVFKRGIRYATAPTTLLAMVDASVGGKTGFDTSFGKNSVGLFNQPEGVFIDTAFLETLPENIYREGMAEAVKCGLIAGGELWENIKNRAGTEQIIRGCVELKAEIVAGDEFDNGKRHVLNLGHTLGHAIEEASDYTIPHGFSVSMGLSCVYPKVDPVLELYGLPTSKDLKIKEKLLEKAFENVKFDKKAAGNGLIDVVTVKKPGDVEITRMSDADFRRLIVGNV